LPAAPSPDGLPIAPADPSATDGAAPAATPTIAGPPTIAADPSAATIGTPTIDAAPSPDVAAPSGVLAMPMPPATDAAPVVEATPAPARGPAKSKKSPRRPSRPAQAPRPTPPPPSPKPTQAVAGPDPVALLREAEKAFADGRYGTALRNGQRSAALKADARATRIVALSACKLGRAEVAAAAIERLPMGQRRSVRNTCRDANVKV
jgi:hypothetical protein